MSYLRRQGGWRMIQMSTYGAQVAFAANSMYYATKFGIEGFCEALAQEVAQFNIGMTMVEPGGARTEFRYGSAKAAELMPEYETATGFSICWTPPRAWCSVIPSGWRSAS